MPSPSKVFGALAVAACASAPLRAQDLQPERSGLMAVVGAGIGSAGVSCDPRCSSDRRSGPIFVVRGGAYVSPSLTLDLETSLFRQNVENSDGSQGRWALSWYLVGLQWFPRAEDDFYVHVGVGLGAARANVSFPNIGTLDLNASDIGGVLGVGRELRLTNNVGATVFGEYLFMVKTGASLGRSDSGAKLSADILHAGIALLFF
jgi:hypothetical protein